MANKKIDNKKIWDNIWNDVSDYKLYAPGIRYVSYLIEDLIEKANLFEINNIYDMGCGDGWRTNHLSTIFPNAKITGLDFTSKGINVAKNKYHANKNLKFIVSDVENLKEKDSIDMVTSFDVLEHIEDWQKALSSWANLNPKYMLLSFPAVRKCTKYDKQYGHFRHYQRGEVEHFLKTIGYKKVKVYYAGFPSLCFLHIISLRSPKYGQVIESKVTNKMKILLNFLYFFIKTFSFKNIGCQFIGIFVKDEE